MAQLSAAERARLPDNAFAYVDSNGERRLPIHDVSHVRNALARFNRVKFESDVARQKARQRLLTAAKKHGIVPLGFIESELKADHGHAAAGRVVIEAAHIRTPAELETQLRGALRDPALSLSVWSSDEASWVDGAGASVTLPAASPTRSVTVLESRGEPLVALAHDPSVLADADVADAVLGAIRFVVERQRLESDPSVRVDRSQLPTGFLTHLLTDIEGSTELLTQLTDRYAEVLAKVRRVIRQEVRRHGGREVDVTGDESYSVFEDASGAVAAAVAFQRRLEAGRWPDKLAVRVRAGIHSGEVTLSEGGYVGMALNTTARVMSAGHGGQILVTAASRAAMTAPDGVRLSSLGSHTMKDLPEPIELFEVEADGVRQRFPPLRVR
ncbi:MAG TPA: adenylate/guanylate cyclase domain-containing protein [Acidimicrobiia bacterium]|nr:adenylate/guanylate cyclase domain-containing protein [Acidimicrobiia bacterium]